MTNESQAVPGETAPATGLPGAMRVLMTADPLGDAWTYVLELSSALAQHGVQVGLATMGAPLRHEQRESARQVPDLELFESGFKLEWMQDPWEDVAAAGEWLLRLEARFGPDIVHLNGYAHAALPWSRPRLVAGHSCVLSWWEAVLGEAAPSGWNRYRAEVTRGLAAADLVIAPSRTMLASLERLYGPIRNGMVVPNGRDPSRFLPGPKDDIVLTAGRLWDPARNVTTLECIAAQLPWPVYLAGEEKSPHDSAVQFTSIRFLGRLSPEALAAWQRRAAIYVLPARYEPFGLSILEAALAGCALILGDIPSLRETWGDAALFVPPNNVRAVKAALEVLIWDTSRRASMAARARARALEFSPQRMAAGYLNAYGRLMSLRQDSGLKSGAACAS